jgi:DNA ligase-1
MTLLHHIVETSERVAATRARREKIAAIAACLGRLEKEEVEMAVGFLAGAPRQGRVGIGWAGVRDVRPQAAAAAPGLTVREVDETLERIKGTSGRGSKAARHAALAGLLARATPAEQRFLQRLLIGEVRQGALEGVMIEGIARAAGIPAADVRRAVMLRGDLGAVAVVALGEGSAGLARFTIEVFRPIQPMLAQTAESVTDALDRLGRAALDWKLDGARIQVHRRGDDVRVFSRTLNDVTASVPEVVEAALRLPVTEIVADGEAIALRPDATPLPFQTTMRRFGRRSDVARLREEIPIVPVLFDCLRVDGDDLIDRPGAERLEIMTGLLPEDLVVPRVVTSDADEAGAFLDDALRRGHEGVVVKNLETPYEAGRRGAGWLKVKPTHTLDLVVLAAEWGSGRRRGWLSNLHLGARDPAGGAFVMLGKTFKGLTDEMLAWQTTRLHEIAIARDEHTVHVRPELVVEVAFDGVQASPQYPGGVALRFARVKRYRDDKTAAEADTIDAVHAIHRGGR